MEEPTENYFSRLPTEIMERIFSFLSMSDMFYCERVCIRWRSFATNLPEPRMKRECREAFNSVYLEAKRVSGLSWYQLYKSLSSWGDLHTGSMRVYSTSSVDFGCSTFLESGEVLKRLQFLKGGIVSYAQFAGDYDNAEGPLDFNARLGMCNSVIYYDTKTLRSIDIVDYDFDFWFYAENDEAAVFRCQSGALLIKDKTDDTIHEFGTMKSKYYERKKQLYLYGKDVYYFNHLQELCVASLTSEEPWVRSRVIVPYKSGFISLTVKDDKVYILVSVYPPRQWEDHYRHYGQFPPFIGIYDVTDGQYTLVRKLENNRDENLRKNSLINVEILKQYGFDWFDYRIYKAHVVRPTKLKQATIYCYGDVVFIGTKIRTFHMYMGAYRQGKLHLNRRPDILIDLREYLDIDYERESIYGEQRRVTQIGVVETAGGHRIVLLYCHRIVTIEFGKWVLKRKYSTSSLTPQDDDDEIW